jgi:hypothetical protein
VTHLYEVCLLLIIRFHTFARYVTFCYRKLFICATFLFWDASLTFFTLEIYEFHVYHTLFTFQGPSKPYNHHTACLYRFILLLCFPAPFWAALSYYHAVFYLSTVFLLFLDFCNSSLCFLQLITLSDGLYNITPALHHFNLVTIAFYAVHTIYASFSIVYSI